MPFKLGRPPFKLTSSPFKLESRRLSSDPRPSELSLSGGAGYAQVGILLQTSLKIVIFFTTELIRPPPMLDTLELIRPELSLSGHMAELIRPLPELIRPNN